ncbi:MAG: PD-(D/E)XK nuclease family protein [Muribaculaceae bacterium]|nr:PD-(D/E)XK nuclease family protein [Muribaculaceae bacterium]
MKPFLRQVAEAYIENKPDELIDICFVFPNKRCAAFFADYMGEAMTSTMFLPAMTSIDELVCDLTKSVVETKLELLFDLYECYRDIIKRRADDTTDDSFDSFMPWGEMVVNDFDDIDRYCVDAGQLLRNIMHFKEIASNYLTDEQIEIINRYWNDPILYADQVHLWRHISPDDSAGAKVKNFFNLWVIMDELYRSFRKRLAKKGRAYSGMAYRTAAEMTPLLNAGQMPFKRYVFVGFNALSSSEETILKWFRDNKIGDFYWDWDFYSSPETENVNPAGNFVNHYRKLFPQADDIDYPFERYKPMATPSITIIGVPSKIGQVKETARLLTDMIATAPLDFKGEKAKETAVVLPEENLCLPLVSSFSEGTCKINVTMGYPMRFTPVSTLMKNIEKMVNNSKILHGSLTYYYQDMIAVMSHPMIKESFRSESDTIIAQIHKSHIFNYRRDDLIAAYPQLKPLFPHRGSTDAEALNAISDMLQMLKQLTGNSNLDHTFVLQYIKVLDTLREVCESHDISLSRSTIISMLSRLADGETVNFEGNPLDGIQVMGVLETRALDFENLFLLSMNEGIFPRNTHQNSFIPNEMRAAYGMSTIERHEAIYAYYFYRLLSRARNVWLIYDSRSGNGSGELSRYISQLRYLVQPQQMKFINKSYQIKPSNTREIILHKTSTNQPGVAKSDDIMRKINQFRDPENPRYLSPSSINRFLECPLGFFLEYVADFREPDEIKDYIDEGKWGTIVHLAMEYIYNDLSKSNQIITPELLRVVLHSQKSMIEKHVVRAFMREFLKQDYGCDTPLKLSSLSGANMLLAEMIMMLVRKIMEREAESNYFGNFEFLHGEMKFQEHLKVSPSLSINIKGSIDRVDRTFSPDGTEIIKLIDYKTGKADNKFASASDLFENVDEKKAIIQLMLYCNAYALKNNFNGIIKPLVYKVKELATSPIEHIMFSKENLDDYRLINRDFLAELEKAIAPLFNPEQPFTQADDNKACTYCKFTGICDRTPKQF